jgi:hypothetical protein
MTAKRIEEEKKNKKRTAISLRQDQVTKLEEITEKVGIPMAEQVRRGVDMWLKEQGK